MARPEIGESHEGLVTHCLKTPEQSLHDQDHLEVPLGLLGLGFLQSPIGPCTS